MKIVIINYNQMRSTLTRKLVAKKHKINIVNELMSSFGHLNEDFTGQIMVDSNIDKKMLHQTGIKTTNYFTSITNKNNRNIMAAQITQKIFHVRQMITRIYDPIRAEVYRELKLETICPTTIDAGILDEFFSTKVNPAHSDRLISDDARKQG